LLRVAVLSLVTLLGLPVVAEGAELDRSFGNAGSRTFVTDGCDAPTVAPGRGGRIWMLENSSTTARIIALNRRGDLDAGFGEGGTVRIDNAIATFPVPLTSGGVLVFRR
jgi:hypothetical protein